MREIATRAASTNLASFDSLASKCNPVVNLTQYRGFGALSTIVQKWDPVTTVRHKTLLNYAASKSQPALTMPVEPIVLPVRTKTKFTMARGKPATVKAVIKRFYRLDWGIWIRTKAGRKKHLWRKSCARKKRLREHVFCNAQQSTLLDKMVSKWWKRRHYYVDDPYNPYHEREEFLITRKKPLP